MDVSTLIGIGGLLLTALFGIPAFVTLKQQRKPRLYYFEYQNIKLQNELTKNISDLSISYRGNEVSEQIFLLKGIFLYLGTRDVQSSDINRGISIRLEGESPRILNQQILHQKTDLTLYASTPSQDEIIVDFDLLTNMDYFVIEILGDSGKNSVNVSHRIAHVDQNISRGDLDVVRDAKRWIMPSLLMMILTISMFDISFPNQSLNTYDLKASYSINNDRYVPYDTFASAYEIPYPTLNVDSSIDAASRLRSITEYNRAVDSVFEVKTWPLKVRGRVDSLTEVVAKEYKHLELARIGTTRSYSVDPRVKVKYSLTYGGFSDYLQALIPIGFFLFFWIVPIYVYIRYFKYRRITKLANSIAQRLS